MLIKVLALDHSFVYNHPPPIVESLINTNDIVCAVPTDSTPDTPLIIVRFRDGYQLTVLGTADSLLQLFIQRGA